MKKTLRIVAICFFTIAILLSTLFIIHNVIYLAFDDSSTTVNFVINKQCYTAEEYYNETLKYLGSKVKELSLTKAEVKFQGCENIKNNQATQIIFYFSKYIDDSAEGGRIEAIGKTP